MWGWPRYTNEMEEGGVVKTAIAKTRNAETRSPAESLEFTAPTYWLRKHTKLRLVKHSPDTCPTPAFTPSVYIHPFTTPLLPATVVSRERNVRRDRLHGKIFREISPTAHAEKVAAVFANSSERAPKMFAQISILAALDVQAMK